MNVPEDIYWHISLRDSERTEMEARYMDLLFRKFGRVKKILDVACGYGRHHGFLRELGYEVYGFDASERLIHKAKELHKGYERYYWVQDMRDGPYGRYDGIVSWFTSFGYFDDKTNRKVLEHMGNSLKRNGVLLIEIPNRDWYRFSGYREENFFVDYGEWVELTKFRVSGKHSILEMRFYRKSGNDLIFADVHRRRVRLYGISEMQRMVEELGMEFHAFSGLRRAGPGTHRFVAVGVKK